MKRYIKSAIANLGNEDLDSRIAIAKDPNTPLDVLEMLSNDRSYKVRLRVIKNPNATPELLARMAEQVLPLCGGWGKTSYQIDLCAALVGNQNTPMDWRLKLLNTPVGSQCVYNLTTLARGKNTPAEILTMMADIFIDRQHNSDVLEYITRNPNTPVDTLRKINDAFGHHYRTYTALSKNPNTPGDVLLGLLQNEYLEQESVDALLRHPNLAKEAKAEYKAAIAEEKKKNSLRRYIGKDVWLSGELYGISRDFLCYFRIVRAVDSRKKIYEVNVLYDNTSWNDEPIEKAMQETEIERFDDSEESDGQIYKPVTTYTTDELLKKLYPDFDED